MTTNLYEHQKTAVEKLRKLKVGALFMEQGTGKTRTALELISIRRDSGKASHTIWLCPCSVKENLYRDIIKHAGYMPDDITICGIETLSTSYRTLNKLRDIAEHNDCCLIVDESSLVKNPSAIRTKNIVNLSLLCKYRLILNGTPITKNEADLFSQFYILDWRILGYQSYYSFAANHLEYDDYGKVRRCLNTDYLSEKVAPYSFQIKKDDCLDLPDKQYLNRYYMLTQEQEKEYDRVKEAYLELVKEEDEATIYRLFTALQLVLSGRKITSKPAERIQHVPMFDKPEDNPRIVALMDLLRLMPDKCIIYCKYVQEIHDICDIINKEYGQGSAVAFDGGLNLKKRQKSIDSFSGNARFFVANKRCAGFGLNLQFCSNVVYYNNDFDLATRLQSEDRIHRIGQTEKCTYYDIVAFSKLDERIAKCLQKKENLLESFRKEIKERNGVEVCDPDRIESPAAEKGSRKIVRRSRKNKGVLLPQQA